MIDQYSGPSEADLGLTFQRYLPITFYACMDWILINRIIHYGRYGNFLYKSDVLL